MLLYCRISFKKKVIIIITAAATTTQPKKGTVRSTGSELEPSRFHQPQRQKGQRSWAKPGSYKKKIQNRKTLKSLLIPEMEIK